jgi:hypothetical protein
LLRGLGALAITSIATTIAIATAAAAALIVPLVAAP